MGAVAGGEPGEPPVRLCCGQRHWGVGCPDGLVMCCLCYHRFPITALHRDAEGTLWDACQGCAEYEEERRGDAHQG